MSDPLTTRFIEIQGVEQTFKPKKGRSRRCATST
jgi:hypothetical protein